MASIPGGRTAKAIAVLVVAGAAAVAPRALRKVQRSGGGGCGGDGEPPCKK